VTALRRATASDTDRIAQIASHAGLFPGAMTGAMMAGYLAGEDALWIVAEAGARITGFAFSQVEQLTEGTYNLRAMAVVADLRGTGIGSRLLAESEQLLAATGGRILLVETSSTPDFDATAAFYRNRGFTAEARIRDYWAAGDDKLIFRKALQPS
jgi:ribosomal protein S18 acetylase RimI-like enzyme